MTFLHIGDLHLGKKQNGFDLLPDQRLILDDITEICRERRADALLICGDVYDAALPPKEAVTLLDDFICGIAALGTAVLMISGNHDGAERLRFGGRLMSRAGVYIAGETDSLPVASVTLCGARFVMLPFLRLADIKKMLGSDAPASPGEAFSAIFGTLPPFSGRQVLLSHQFYLPPSGDILRCGSESPTVGGLEAIPSDVLGMFDYAALGHIHTPQEVGRRTVRYCGSPLKYSASEALSGKSVPFVTLSGDGAAEVELIPLTPKRDVRVISGGFEQLMSAAAEASEEDRDHYYYVTLTGGDEPPDAMTRLRYYYPNIMQLTAAAKGTADADMPDVTDDIDDGQSVSGMFGEFFRRQNGREPDGREKELAEEAEKACAEDQT